MRILSSAWQWAHVPRASSGMAHPGTVQVYPGFVRKSSGKPGFTRLETTFWPFVVPHRPPHPRTSRTNSFSWTCQESSQVPPHYRSGGPLGGAMGAVLGVLLRNYGFTDLPPSLPLPRSDPVTRISESSYRRLPAYTHPGVRIRTHPRIRTHHRVQAHMRIRGVGCVNAPIRVYAPDAAYTRGRDERHAEKAVASISRFAFKKECEFCNLDGKKHRGDRVLIRL